MEATAAKWGRVFSGGGGVEGEVNTICAYIPLTPLSKLAPVPRHLLDQSASSSWSGGPNSTSKLKWLGVSPKLQKFQQLQQQQQQQGRAHSAQGMEAVSPATPFHDSLLFSSPSGSLVSHVATAPILSPPVQEKVQQQQQEEELLCMESPLPAINLAGRFTREGGGGGDDSDFFEEPTPLPRAFFLKPK